MRVKNIGLLLLTVFFMMPVMTGCDTNVLEGMSDSDSYSAQLEDARIALDKFDFKTAELILENMRADGYETPVVLNYLSNALSGQAGLDTFRFLQYLDDIQKDEYQNAIDLVGTILADTSKTLTYEQITHIESLLFQSLLLLGDIKEFSLKTSDKDPDLILSGLNDDQKVQAGLVAFNHMVVLICQIVVEDLNLQGLELSRDTIHALYAAGVSISEGAISEERLTRLTADLKVLLESVAALAEIMGKYNPDASNDISKEFEELIEKVDADGDGVISKSDIEHYLSLM